MKTVLILLLNLSFLVSSAREGLELKPSSNSDTTQFKGRTMFTLELGGLFCLRRTDFAKGYFKVLPSRQPNLEFSAFQITANVNKEIKQRLYIGGGFGFDICKHPMLTSTTDNVSVAIPAYFDIRYHFIPGKASPYIAAHTGAAMYFTRGEFGGRSDGWPRVWWPCDRR
jgi:hypothetical protein